MPLMSFLRSVGNSLAAPFRRSAAPAPIPHALPFAPQSDPRLMAWARGVVEKVRTAAAAGHLRFLPHLDFYTGETPEIREQYRQMLREPTLKAAVGTKVLSVAQLDPQAHPEDPDDPRQREAGDFVLYALRKLRGGPRALAWSVLVHGLLDGWSVCEKVWRREPVPSGRFTGKRIYRTVKAKDSRTLTPVVDEFKNVEGIRAGLYNAGRVFSPDDFVTWSHMPLFESPVGMSDFRAPYRAYWIKNTTWQLRGLHLEKWTGPFLRGEYGHADQKATLEAALEEARAHTWITVPAGTLVEALEISTKGTADFEAALRDCDREMLIGTVGASLQILEGQVTDARGDTGEHRATSELFQWMLAAALGDVVTECMAPELVEVNYAGVEPPAITWGSVSERDMQARLATDKGLQEIGLRLSKKEAYRHYSRAEPADEADVLKPDKGGAQPPPGSPPGGNGGGGPGPGGPASPFDGLPDAGAAFSEDHWHEAGVLCYAESPAAHKVGDVWKGPSGRWFTRRQDGRIVPAKNPNAEKPGAKKAPVKAAAPAGKASLDDIHGEVEAARKGGLTPEKLSELGKRIAEHLSVVQINELKKRLGAGFAGKGGVGTGPKQALADRIAARAAELAAAAPAEPKPAAPEKQEPAATPAGSGVHPAEGQRPQRISKEETEAKPWEYDADQYQSAHGVHAPWIAEISPMQYGQMSKRQQEQYDEKRRGQWQASADIKAEWGGKVIAAYEAGQVSPDTPGVSEAAKSAIFHHDRQKKEMQAKVDAAAAQQARRITSPADVKLGDRVHSPIYQEGTVVKINRKTVVVELDRPKGSRVTIAAMPEGPTQLERVEQPTPSAAPATAPQPPSPGFTGIDANGHQWQNGVQVARQEEPGKGREPGKSEPAEPQTVGPSATVPRKQWVASLPNDAEGVKELVGGLDHDVKIIRRKDGRVTVEARPKAHLRGRMDVKAAIETGPDLQHAAARAYESLYGSHRATVQAALAAGKTVPPEVLADYPDLDPATHAAALPGIVKKLDVRGANLVSVADVRDVLASRGVQGRQQQDAVIAAAMKSGKLSGAGLEHTHGMDAAKAKRLRDASIPGHGGAPATGYLAVRD